MNYFVAGFVITSGFSILACSSSESQQSTPTDGGGGANTGGSSGASSGGSAGRGTGGSSGASTGGSSGASTGGSSGRGAGGSSGRGAGGSSGASAGGSSGSSGGSAGSTGGSASDGGVDVCSTCGVGELCVAHQTEGGALFFPDDAGHCPFGRVPTSGPNPRCVLPPGYTCETLPAACTPPPGSPPVAHCICARSLCGSANLCVDVSPTLMRCTMQVP